MIEADRLNYIRTHQKQLRLELYKNIVGAVLRGHIYSPSFTGLQIVLPSLLTGRARYMMQNFHFFKMSGYMQVVWISRFV